MKKLGYAMGDMGISVSYFAVGFFFMFYLTDMVGLSPAAAGLALFIGKLWDGVNDPLMGIISDRTVSRFGKKRVYVLFGSIALAVSFMLLWTVPLGAPAWGRFLWATVSLLLYSTAYTVVVVPYMALVPSSAMIMMSGRRLLPCGRFCRRWPRLWEEAWLYCFLPLQIRLKASGGNGGVWPLYHGSL
jgi:Na+/melibiose symporter-like transporter